MASEPIQPTRVYTVRQASKVIGTSEGTLMGEIKKGNLDAVELGKGYKILGENLMVFMKSPSLTKVNLDNVPTLDTKK